MSDRDRSSWLQDRPTTAQSRAHQQQWEHLHVNTFKKGKKQLCYSSWERRVRICKRTNSADIKVNEREGGASGTRAEISLQPVERAMVTQGCSLQPMEIHSGTDIHLQPLEARMPEQVNVP